MLKYIAIFFILFFLYLLLFVMGVNVVFEYIRNKRGEWAMLYFCIRNDIIEYTYDLTLLDKDKNKKGFKLKSGKKRREMIRNQSRKKLGPEELYKKIVNFKENFSERKEYVDYIIGYINKKNIKVDINVDVLQGNGDAAQTGLICGLLWSIAGILESNISRYVKKYQRKVMIKPCFNKKVFEINISCIIHVKLVHIIKVLMKTFLIKHKLKQKSKKTVGGEISG
jgi:hypothetical protein